MIKNILNSVVITGFAFLLISCGKKEKPVEQVRSIKTITISSKATGQIRKISGIVSAVNYSFLSFEDVEGRVVKLNVDIGDTVKKGEVLAVLDRQKYELDLKNANANLKKSEAALVKSESDFQRADKLYRDEVISKKEFESRTYQLAAAKSGVAAAKANLGLANRNLKHTELKSPYNGFVGERFIQPNQEVRKGEKIFRIDEKGEMEVDFSIPETLRGKFKLKEEGVVKFPGQLGGEVKCKISFLGTAANRGNAFPAKAQLINPPETIKPGMTAEVLFSLAVETKGAGFLIPPEAVLMGKEKRTGFVFVYNPATSTVKRIKVHFEGSQANSGIVSDGIKEGDVIAVAGISFLMDGMKVKLYKPTSKGGE